MSQFFVISFSGVLGAPVKKIYHVVLTFQSLDSLFEMYNKSSPLGTLSGQTFITGPAAHPKKQAPAIKAYVNKAVHCLGNFHFVVNKCQ